MYEWERNENIWQAYNEINRLYEIRKILTDVRSEVDYSCEIESLTMIPDPLD